MQKLLIVHNDYIHAGGEEAVVSHEIRTLREAGYPITEYRVRSGPGAARIARAAMAPWGGSDRELETLIRQEQPDILHAHNLFPLLSPRLFALARRLGLRTVQTLHNYRPLCLNGLFLTPSHEICERCAEGNYWPGILRGCYRKNRLQSAELAAHLTMATMSEWYRSVDQFIAPCEFLRQKFIDQDYEADRITVQGHFLPEFSLEDPVPPKPYVLYLGRLSDEKGVQWLLNVFREPRISLTLKIAGRGPLDEYVRKTSGNSIEYLGFIEGQQKQDYLKHASVLVMPSQCYENFPLAIMEANACGTPALVSDLGGLAEIVRSGENGAAFDLHNPNSFWETLRQMTQNSDSVAARRRCQSYARKQYSKAMFLEHRRQIYDELFSYNTVHLQSS